MGNWKPFPNVTAILQKLSAPLLSKAEAYSPLHVKHFGQLPAAPLTEAQLTGHLWIFAKYFYPGQCGPESGF